MEKILRQAYYDPNSPAISTGTEAVYKAAKALYPKITSRKVATWLSKQFTYTMHKPVCFHFKTNGVFTESIACELIAPKFSTALTRVFAKNKPLLE